MTYKPFENSVILWQEWEEDTAAEPAILVETYPTCVVIKQLDSEVILNLHHVKDLIKLLKEAKP